MPDTIEIKHKTVTQIAKIVNDNMTRYNAHQTLATLGWLVAGPFMFKPTAKYKQTLLRHLKVSQARTLTQKHIDMFTSPERTDAVLGEPFESVGEYGMNKFLLGNMATPIAVGNGRFLYTDSFVIATMNKLFPDAELKFEQLYDYQRLQTQGQLKWQIDGEVVAVSITVETAKRK